MENEVVGPTICEEPYFDGDEFVTCCYLNKGHRGFHKAQNHGSDVTWFYQDSVLR